VALLVFKTSDPHHAGGGFDSHPLPPNIMPSENKPLADAVKMLPVSRLRDGALTHLDDTLVVEEPLEIRLGSERFTVTMRTPGNDFALTRGLLLTEGVIDSEADIGQIRYCDTGEAADSDVPNIVTVQLKKPPVAGRLWQRSLMAGTSCGLCGKAALEAVGMQTRPLPPPASPVVSRKTLLALPHTLRRHQALFQQTGGLHAVGLFDGTGECRCVFEDIGRHNATDKAIGHGVEHSWLPWAGDDPLILLVSGRASFEITQKALMARIPVVCSVSAASTLAVELAQANDQTLVGFLRDTGMTIYAGGERLLS
jgi:FdhD protein